MSNFACKTFAALLLAALGASAHAGTTTQSTSAVNYSTTGWHNDLLSQVSFANGTDAVTSLTGSVTISDQGWGGQDEGNNQLYLSLNVDGNSLWGDHFAGALHGARLVSFDLASDKTQFDGLNSILKSIDWSSSHDVSLQLRSSTIGYGGWALYAQNAQFGVTSVTAVPEPGTYALMGAGLLGVGFVARRRKPN